MSVYVFSDGKNIYKEKTYDNFSMSHISTKDDTKKLSVITLEEKTSVDKLIQYSDILRNELRDIEQLFLNNPTQQNDYTKFLDIKQEIFEKIDKLIELYQLYNDVSKLTVDRKTAIRNKILNIGLELRSIIQSFNTSGIFVSKNNRAIVPTPNSYEQILRSRLLQSIPEL